MTPEEIQKVLNSDKGNEFMGHYIWRNSDGSIADDFPGYEYADKFFKTVYNPDGSLNDYHRSRTLADGGTQADISRDEEMAKEKLKRLSQWALDQEKQWGVRPEPVPEVSYEEQFRANKQAIRDGDDLSELPYAMDQDDYHDLKYGSDPTRYM